MTDKSAVFHNLGKEIGVGLGFLLFAVMLMVAD
jgi:hypothetical protein